MRTVANPDHETTNLVEAVFHPFMAILRPSRVLWTGVSTRTRSLGHREPSLAGQ